MAEIWGAAIVAGAGIVSGAMSSRAAKKQSKFEAQASKEMVPLQGLEERRNIAFGLEYEDFMNQRNKQRKANAFAGLAKKMGGSGIAPTIEANRPDDPNPSGALAAARPAGALSRVPENNVQQLA